MYVIIQYNYDHSNVQVLQNKALILKEVIDVQKLVGLPLPTLELLEHLSLVEKNLC